MLKVDDFSWNAMKALAAEEAAGFGDVLDLEALNHSFREVSAAERLAELSDKMNPIGSCLTACRGPVLQDPWMFEHSSRSLRPVSLLLTLLPLPQLMSKCHLLMSLILLTSG